MYKRVIQSRPTAWWNLLCELNIIIIIIQSSQSNLGLITLILATETGLCCRKLMNNSAYVWSVHLLVFGREHRFGRLISPLPHVNDCERTYGADLTRRVISVGLRSGHFACWWEQNQIPPLYVISTVPFLTICILTKQWTN